MATAYDIVLRAFRKIGVAATDEVLTADQIGNGLDALNMMMNGWVLAGVDTSHVDLSAGDDFPLPAQFEEGAVYLLAARLSPDYSIPPAFDADDWFRKFQSAYMLIDDVVMPRGLMKLPSQYSRRKVARGGFGVA